MIQKIHKYPNRFTHGLELVEKCKIALGIPGKLDTFSCS